MHIQKRGTSFYLKNSVWNNIQQKTISSTKYLGKDVDTALEKLGTFVQPYEYLVLKDKLLAVAVRPVDVMREVKRHISKAHKLAEQVDDDELQAAINALVLMIGRG